MHSTGIVVRANGGPGMCRTSGGRIVTRGSLDDGAPSKLSRPVAQVLRSQIVPQSLRRTRPVPLFRSFIPSNMFEILACNRPILASLEGDAAEILRATGAAVVVPPEDVNALESALRSLAGDAAGRAALAARGSPYVAEHFDRQTLANRYLEILKGIARDDSLQL